MRSLLLLVGVAGCSGSWNIDLTGLAPLSATAPAQLAPLGEGLVKAVGGTPPYTFAFESDPPATGSDAQLDTVSGEFRLGSTGRTTESLRVTDKRNETQLLTIEVGEALAIDPTRAVVDPSALADFDAVGGAPPYTFHIEGVTEDRVASDTGIFVAGATGGRAATVIVTDANGAEARAEIQVALNFTAGASPSEVAILDANRDGLLDVAVAPNNGGAVILLAGNGRGSFAPLTEIAVDAFPKALDAKDLNGDGLVDLVVAVTSPEQVIVLLQDSTAIGGFREVSRQPIATLPMDVVAMPLADGTLNVLTASDTGRAVDITHLRITGMQATFLDTTRLAMPGRATRIALADLIGDGNVDLAVGIARAQPAKGSVLYFTGNGSTFAATAAYEVVVGEGTIAMGAGKLGGGAKEDLAVSSSLSNELGLVFDVGGVPTLERFAISAGDGSQCAPCGRSEDAACGSGAQCITMRPTDETQVCALTCSSNADCPNDTDCQQIGGANFCTPQLNKCPVSSMLSTGVNARAVHIADLDLDGVPEILVSTVADVDVFRAGGTRLYYHAYRAATGLNPWEMAIADLNSDTFPDVITANRFRQNVSVLLGLGRLFTPIAEHAVGSSPTATALGNLDRDERQACDIVVQTDSTMLTLLGDGHGTFVTYRQTPFTSPGRPMLVDLDGDGDLDLLAFHNLLRTLEFTPWENGIGFTGGPETSTGVQPVSLALRDVNGDGNLDALIANNLGDRNFGVLWGQGGGVFTPNSLDASLFSYTNPALLPQDIVAMTGHFLTSARGGGVTQLDAVEAGADGHGTSVWSETVTGAGLIPIGLDCNGDGRLDFAQLYTTVANNAFDGRVWRSTGIGYEVTADLHIGEPIAGTPGAYTASGPDSLVAADIDGDGDADLVASTRLTKQLVVFKGNGDCTFTLAGRVRTALALSGLSAADLDGDGLPDLAATAQPNKLSIFQNMGTRSAELRSFPAAGRLCDPCTDDSQCGGAADLCADHVGLRTVCTRDCSGGRACPLGFECKDVQGSKQCVHTGDQCVY